MSANFRICLSVFLLLPVFVYATMYASLAASGIVPTPSAMYGEYRIEKAGGRFRDDWLDDSERSLSIHAVPGKHIDLRSIGRHIFYLPPINLVYIDYPDFGADQLALFPTIHALENLSLSRCILDERFADALLRHKKLEGLSISDSAIRPGFFCRLGNHPRLQSLGISNSTNPSNGRLLTTDDLVELDLSNLKHVGISSSGIVSLPVPAPGTRCSLESVFLPANFAESASLKLLSLPSMKDMYFDTGANVTDAIRAAAKSRGIQVRLVQKN